MIVIPTFASLFGPFPGGGLIIDPVGSQWKFLTALTANTKLFEFQLGYAEIERARWMLVWTPNNVAMAARLVAFDQATNGVMENPIELAVIQSQGYMTPVPQAILITDAFQSLICMKKPKQVGMQVKDDGVNHWILFESRLELNFRV